MHAVHYSTCPGSAVCCSGGHTQGRAITPALLIGPLIRLQVKHRLGSSTVELFFLSALLPKAVIEHMPPSLFVTDLVQRNRCAPCSLYVAHLHCCVPQSLCCLHLCCQCIAPCLAFRQCARNQPPTIAL